MPQRRRLAPEYATTEDIMEAAGVTRRTVTSWVQRGLLPSPVRVTHGYPLGTFNRYPASVLTRARFIAAKRLEGLKLDEILELLKAEDGAPPRRKVASRRAATTPSKRRR